MLRVEDVRGRRVVDDDGVLQVSADLGEILDVVSLVVVAAFAEKSVVDDLVDVQLVQERIAILKRAVSGGPGPVRGWGKTWKSERTLETEAVKTTTS